MAYTNPGWTNNSEPYINASELNKMSNEIVRLGTVLERVPVANGGTGATSASGARANLGLDTTGINAMINGTALPLSLGGTGQTSRAGILAMIGMSDQGTAFQVFSGRDYRTLKGYPTSMVTTLSTIDIPSCIYIGGSTTDDYISFTDAVSSTIASGGKYYVLTFFSPDATATRRVQFIIPEVDNRSVYMRITHGSGTSGWGKLSFASI